MGIVELETALDDAIEGRELVTRRIRAVLEKDATTLAGINARHGTLVRLAGALLIAEERVMSAMSRLEAARIHAAGGLAVSAAEK